MRLQPFLLSIFVMAIQGIVVQSQTSFPPLRTILKSDVWMFDFSPDGQFIAIGSEGSGEIFETETGAPVRTFTGQHRFMRYLPHGRQIAMMETANALSRTVIVSIYDTATGFLVHTFPDQNVHNFKISPDGKWILIATGSVGTQFTLYNLEGFEMEWSFVSEISSPPLIDISRDSQYFVISQARSFSPRFGPNTPKIFVYRLDNHELVTSIEESKNGTMQMSFMPDHQTILISEADGRNVFWNWKANTTSVINSYFATTMDHAITSDGRFALFGRADSKAILHNLQTNQDVATLSSARHVDVRVAISPDGSKALTRGRNNNSVHLWNIGPFVHPNQETPTLAPLPPTPTITPTPTVTPTPTPTPTFNPRPTTELLVPNVEAEFMAFTSGLPLAVNPLDGGLYVSSKRKKVHTIRGPLAPGIADVDDAPAYAEFAGRHDSILAFDQQGVLYVDQGGEFYRVPERGRVELLGSIVQVNPEVRLVDMIAKPESIILPENTNARILGLSGTTKSKSGIIQQVNTKILGIHDRNDILQIEVLFNFTGDFFPKAMTVGPDNRLYLIGQPLGSHNYSLRRLESNGTLTDVFLLNIPPGGNPKDMVYWQEDEAFYVTSYDSYLWRIDLFNNAATPIFDLDTFFNSLAVSHDGNSILATAQVENTQNGSVLHTIQKLSVTSPFQLEGETPSEVPIATPLPEGVPTVTHTPTPTNTPTPVPELYEDINRFFDIKTLYTDSRYTRLISTHPQTGEIFLVQDGGSQSTGLLGKIAHVMKLPPNFGQRLDRISELFQPFQTFEYHGRNILLDMDVTDKGRLYILQSSRNELLQSLYPDGSSNIWRGFNKLGAVYAVKENDQIPGCEPGEALVLDYGLEPFAGLTNTIYKVNPSIKDEFEVYLSPDELPKGLPIADINTGLDGRLFLLTNPQWAAPGTPTKMLYVTQEKLVREWKHQDMRIHAGPFSFITNTDQFLFASRFDGGNVFWGSQTRAAQPVLQNARLTGNRMAASPDRSRFYVLLEDAAPGSQSLTNVMEFAPRNVPSESPTATPNVPSPTPTPVTGWLVVDGFGGIHQTNPSISRPALPYFFPNDIVRDIEPDPRGRGWYMLDGFGGIHTSSAELPRPNDLPYFGFDIARNLEVEIGIRGEYLFYLLDGFGGVHTNNPSFTFGSLPFIGADIARDFEPVTDNTWMTMDAFGNTYQNFGFLSDRLLYADPSSVFPVMRGMVRFDDGTKVAIDHFAGRHTNPFHPAWDIAEGFPEGFYFPGTDIIWDIEVVPQTFSGN